MSFAKINAEVDYTWFKILDQITRNQKGFVWLDVEIQNAEVAESE